MLDNENMAKICLGTNLRTILKSRDLSLKEISCHTGIPYSTLHTWLEDRQPKDVLKVKKLADYLGVSLDFLLFGESSSPKKTELPRSDDLAGIYEVIITRR